MKQIAVRLALGLMCWLAFRRFNSAASLRFGDSAAAWAAATWALQFHLPFYLSRTLPNVFALFVVLLALQVQLHRGCVCFRARSFGGFAFWLWYIGLGLIAELQEEKHLPVVVSSF